MDFTYDDEQQALREAVRGLLATAYADHDARRRTVADDPGFDRALWGRLAEMGVLGLPFSEADGGVGAGPVEIGIVCQELGRVLAPEPYLARGRARRRPRRRRRDRRAEGRPAGPAQRRRDRAGRGRHLARRSLGLARGRRTRLGLRRHAGRSTAWPTPSWAARPPTTSSSPPPCPTAAPASSSWTPPRRRCTGYVAADLTRAASVRFEASAATPLGEPGRDLSPSIATISDLTRIMGANQALGVMQSQVRATTDYLKSRKQFGVTLNTFQALTFRAADMYVSLELAHSTVDWATMTIAGGDREVVADAADRVGLQVVPGGAPHRAGGDPAPRRHRHDRGVRRRGRHRPPHRARAVARQRRPPPRRGSPPASPTTSWWTRSDGPLADRGAAGLPRPRPRLPRARGRPAPDAVGPRRVGRPRDRAEDGRAGVLRAHHPRGVRRRRAATTSPTPSPWRSSAGPTPRCAASCR